MSEISFPEESAAPKARKLPAHRKVEVNMADKEELSDMVRKAASVAKTRYEDQAERRDFVDRAKKADRMARCSLVRDTADRQYQDTQSNVASTSFFRRLNTIVSNENDLYFPRNGELPVRHEPIPGSDEYTEEEGQRISDSQNLLLQYTFEVDDMQPKIENANMFLNKYANQFYAMEWDYRTEERRSREVATRFDDDLNLETNQVEKIGRPKSFRISKKNRVIADHPTLRIIDFNNIRCDARIDDMQMQSCILERSFPNLSDIYQRQRDGIYMNAGKVGARQLYNGNADEDALGDRQDNADEGSSDQDNWTLLEQWDCWLRLPINEDGEWDEENTLPNWHWATFIGDLDSNAVCVRLIKNPYFHGKNPYQVVHSHRDDKGLFHMGLYDVSVSLYEESTTILNQYFDNKTLINNASWQVEKGNILSTDLVFGKNKVIHVKRLDGIKEVEVKDNTQTTEAAYRRCMDDWDKALNTEAAVLGQPLGSRTSASEAQNIFNQALKPTLDKARYQGEQLFPWIAEMNKELWEQYADPSRVITILRGDKPVEIKPAELWGSLKTRMIAIDKFEDDITRRAEQNNFFQVALPFLAPVIGNKGVATLFNQVMRDRDIIDDVDSVFPANNTFDAKHVARSENHNIYVNGVEDLPTQEEDHEAHGEEHDQYIALVKMLPPDQVNRDNLARLMQHREMHSQMQAQAQQTGQELTPADGQAQAQPQVQDQGAQPGGPGEVSGDALAGLQGGL